MKKTSLLSLALTLIAAGLLQDDPPGYDDTPFLPGGKWRVHDGSRPFPRVVTPGDRPGAPPSDAIVLFDGTDLSAWTGRDDRASWKIEDGYMEVKDRLKDIIISGGENISSIEVESVIYRHPKVAAAAVVARPDEKWGETPCAFVELKPGEEADADDIIAFCREHMAGYNRPKHVVFMNLPKTSTGKIQKFALRELVRNGEV